MDFGMAGAEFRALTMRQWAALVRCKTEAERRRDQVAEIMGGQLIALVANFGRGEGGTVAKATDFMPSQWEKAPKRKSRKRKLEEMEMQRSIWKALAKQGGTYVEAKK